MSNKPLWTKELAGFFAAILMLYLGVMAFCSTMVNRADAIVATCGGEDFFCILITYYIDVIRFAMLYGLLIVLIFAFIDWFFKRRGY